MNSEAEGKKNPSATTAGLTLKLEAVGVSSGANTHTDRHTHFGAWTRMLQRHFLPRAPTDVSHLHLLLPHYARARVVNIRAVRLDVGIYGVTAQLVRATGRQHGHLLTG